MSTMNICKIVPSRSAQQDLIPLNFVAERHYFPLSYHSFHTYSVNLVTEGVGILHTAAGSVPLTRGDLFFTFPEKQFYVENLNSLVYLYITFVGARANALMERLHLSPNNMLFKGNEHLLPFWENALEETDGLNVDLISEAVLLYTFGHVCATSRETENKNDIAFILTIKRYTDEHFTDPTLSLRSIAEQFGYSEKYLSDQFKRTTKVGFRNYLTRLRVEQADKLIKEGVRNVSEIAHFCGFRDPLYFSKVYKQLIGTSPKEAILALNSKRNW